MRSVVVVVDGSGGDGPGICTANMREEEKKKVNENKHIILVSHSFFSRCCFISTLYSSSAFALSFVSIL